MTQENKELLIKDLCARLPYKTAVSVCGIPFHWDYKDFIDSPRLFKAYLNDILRGDVKPYLFPISSMTDEQDKEFMTIPIGYPSVDWFNKNHIDYRGLIEMGLANDATGKNIY